MMNRVFLFLLVGVAPLCAQTFDTTDWTSSLGPANRHNPTQLETLRVDKKGKAPAAAVRRSTASVTRPASTPSPAKRAEASQQLAALKKELASIEKQRDAALEKGEVAKVKTFNLKTKDLNRQIGLQEARLE